MKHKINLASLCSAPIFLISATFSFGETAWTPATSEKVPEITSAGMTSAGFRLEMSAPPGDYLVERSINLLPASWQPVVTLEPEEGFGEMTDAAALSLPAAFYRIAGSFDETRMTLISMEAGVASGGIPAFGVFGGLWTGHGHENFLFQGQDGADGLAKFPEGRFASFRMEPTNPAGVLSAVIESWNDPDEVTMAREADRWTIDGDAGAPFLLKLEGGDHSLAGIFRDSHSDQDSTPWGIYSSNEEVVSTIWAISKSVNADPADLAGDWGFIRVMVDGVESDAIYDGLAFATSITAGSNPRPFSISSVTAFEIEHIWPDGEVEREFGTHPQNPPVQLSLDLSADGSVSIADPEGEPDFKGMVSPSAKLLVATKSEPDLPSPDAGEVDEFIDDIDSAAVQWLVGVKRTNTPALAGKTYRILRQGWWVEGDAFEIDFSGDDDRLVFNAAGTSVTRTSEFNFEGVSFDGVMDSGDETITETMSVNIGPDGGIMLEGGVPGDYTLRTFGFAQEGSKLLILIDAIEAEDDAAGLGMIIAIEVP